jgi:hypothetical protein
MNNAVWGIVAAAVVTVGAQPLVAAGHGPVFGATTPTLGRGGWSIDQAFTLRVGADGEREPMLKTMVSFGITENLQVSGSVPLAMSEGRLANGRMMSLMSSDRELEGLVGYRFQRRTIGIGGRQESTVYAGGTAPLETTRAGVAVGPSLQLGAATGYASRAHYLWVGGGVQHFVDRAGDRIGESRLATIVYGYRPPPLRTEAGRPDLRFFVEGTAEDRPPDRVGAVEAARGTRTVFIGPTALLLYKAVGIEGGILFPAYQQVDDGRVRERVRVAVNVAYFFWLK